MINIHTVRNIVTGLITIGQQFLLDTSGPESPEPQSPLAADPEDTVDTPTPKKRGPKAKTPAESTATAEPVASTVKSETTPPVTRDMIRSALAGYMAIPGVGKEGGKNLFAKFATNPDGTFAFTKVNAVPEEKLAELHKLVQDTALAAAAPDPFAA